MFPYCYTYVYYESYLTVWEECLVQLAISLAAIFVVMLLLTGLDVASTLIMTLVSISHNLSVMSIHEIGLDAQISQPATRTGCNWKTLR